MTNINFELIQPVPYINVNATQGWFYVNYPSGYSYWALQDSNGQQLMTGNYTFPEEVLAMWTTSDQVLIDALLIAAPWDVTIQTTSTTTSTTTIESPSTSTTSSTTTEPESTTTSTTTIKP